MSSCNEFPLHQYTLSLNSLTRQHGLIKGHLVDIDNCFNKVFPSFDPINPELFPGHRIINTFSNHFLFQPFNKQVNCNVTSQVQELDKITIELLESLLTALIILDASLKNNVTTSIAHIHIKNRCCNLRTLEWIQKSNSCIREDTRELNEEFFTK